jgi:hypothetical protein
MKTDEMATRVKELRKNVKKMEAKSFDFLDFMDFLGLIMILVIKIMKKLIFFGFE